MITNEIFNVFLGLLLGIVIYRCYLIPPIMKGPNSKDIVDKIFEYDGKYYEFAPVVCGCLNPKFQQ